jgi:pimeloyl-ACP methyl ester carboxylesterase
MPSVRWTRSSGVHIAYQVLGNGPVDLLWIPSYLSHLELHWQCPPYADLLSTLAQHSRLVVMDKRGVGLSDREHTADLNERAADVQAVLDAVGSAKAVVLASSEGAASAVPFCVRHPERVAGLVLFGSLPSLIAPDFPVGLAAEQYLEHMTWLYDNWGTGRSLESFAPSAAHDPASVAWYARMERDAITPGGLLQMVRTSAAVSYVHLLPQIRVPTLVLHRSNEPVPVEAARLAALLIPGARMVELDGVDHLMWFGDTGPVLNEVRRVLDDALSAPSHG